MPLLFVPALVTTPVSTSAMVTVALAIAAPEGSVTAPLISPVLVFCPHTGSSGKANSKTAAIAHQSRFRVVLIIQPPEVTTANAPSSRVPNVYPFADCGAGAAQRERISRTFIRPRRYGANVRALINRANPTKVGLCVFP